MESDKIIMAIDELDMWVRRTDEIRSSIKACKKSGDAEEERYLRGELSKAEEQVNYYEELIKDMKRALNPNTVKRLYDILLKD
jgi:hypothetical protein